MKNSVSMRKKEESTHDSEIVFVNGTVSIKDHEKMSLSKIKSLVKKETGLTDVKEINFVSSQLKSEGVIWGLNQFIEMGYEFHQIN